MFAEAIRFLLETAVNLLVFAALMRFFFQLLRAPTRNPLAEFVNALTDFAVRPLRRVVPGWYGMDLSSLILAWALEFALLVVLFALGDVAETGSRVPNVVALLLLALVRLLRFSIYMLMAAVFIQVIMSWVGPYNPLMPLLDSLTRPALRPIQRRLPPVGNVDLSPLILFVVCQLLLMLPVTWLEQMARQLA